MLHISILEVLKNLKASLEVVRNKTMNRKDKTLIITGWGYSNYGYATLCAKKHFSNNHAIAISRDSLNTTLLEKAKNYKNIIILGVGITNPEEFIKTIKKVNKLKEQFCIITAYNEVSNDLNLRKKIEQLVTVYSADEDLEVLVKEFFSINGFEFEYNLGRFFNAANYFYREKNDDKFFSKLLEALSKKNVEAVENKFKEELDHFEKYGNHKLLGSSNYIEELKDEIKIIACCDATVMVYGETGTGKEVVAREICKQSHREDKKFRAVNCACFSEELISSELFGYKKGTFTGANEDKDGILHDVNGGTLFLDEIGELSLHIQATLLRLIQDKKYTPVGGHDEKRCDVRIIGATNKNLYKMAKENKFRQDLLYRLDVLPIQLKSLRENLSDIEDIAKGYSLRGDDKNFINDSDIKELIDYQWKNTPWPGNVRELLLILERKRCYKDRKSIKKLLEEHEEKLEEKLEADEGYPINFEDAKKFHVRKIAKSYKTQKAAADALDVTVKTLRKYIKGE